MQTASYAGPDGLGIAESYQYSAAGDVSVKNLAVGSSASISASYSYDSEGRVTSVQYPHTGSSAAVYSYAYDNMGRLTTMLDQNNNQLVSGVTYNAANQWLSISAGSALTGTIGSYIAANPATVALGQLGGSNIYINSARINPSDYYDNLAIVLHEVLHNVTSLTDGDIQGAFGLSTNRVTNNITLKLLKDCF